MSDTIKAWLNEQMVSADTYVAEELLASFLGEMDNGLAGDASSVAMIPAYVGAEGTDNTYLNCVHEGKEALVCVRCLPALIHGQH